MRILFEQNGNTGVYYHRQLTPHAVMVQHIPGVKVDATHNFLDLPDTAFESYDIAVGHGLVSPDKIDRIKNRYKKPYVYDVDDIWFCAPDNPLYNVWKYTNHSAITMQNIKRADAVTCTSDILANYIHLKTGVKAHIFPNAIAETDQQFKPIESKSERLRFAFIGGSTHIMDMPIISKALEKLTTDYPQYADHWQIVYAGFDRDNEIELNAATGATYQIRQSESRTIAIEKYLSLNYTLCDSEYITQLQKYDKSELPTVKQYRRIQTKDIMSYATHFNQCDVVLAPLIDITFNRCKSNLKVVEAGWMGKEIICSNLATFFDRKTESEIKFCSTTEDWVNAMVDHIEHFIQYGTPIKSKLNEIVRQEYNAKNYTQARYELYKSLP